MKYCGQCGRQVPDEARFCDKCGEAVQRQEVTVPAEPGGQGQGTGPGQPGHLNTPPITGKPPGSGFPVKTRTIITGIVIALLLVAGGFWGWRGLGSEAQVQKKLDLAVKYLSENKFEEAVLQYNEVLKIDNKNLIAYKGLGKTYTIQGNYDKAEKTYQDGLNLVDDKKQLRLSMAGLYTDQGKHDLAEKTYAELIAGDSTFILAYEGLAQVLIARGKQDEAIKQLRRCIESNSGNYLSYSLLAEIYMQKGERSQALDLIARSLKINPNQNSAYSLLEKLFNNDWNKIIEYGSTLMAQDETAGRALRIYGYYYAGQYAKAVEEYLALADKGKLCDKAKATAALAYLNNNDSKSADQLIGRIDLKAAKNPFLYADVARYYLEKGDLKQARKIAMEGISLDDTCLENYIVLIELAKKENSSEDYYSCLVMTRSTDSIIVLEKEFKARDIEVKFLISEDISTKKLNEDNSAGTPVHNENLNQETQNKNQVGYSGPLTDDDYILNGIYRGMPQAEAMTILGDSLKVEELNWYRYIYFTDSILCIYTNEYPSIVKKGEVRWFSVESGNISTNRGIKVGDSVEKVMTLYDNKNNYRLNMGDIILYYNNNSNNGERCIGFSIENQKVKSITIGSLVDFQDN